MRLRRLSKGPGLWVLSLSLLILSVCESEAGGGGRQNDQFPEYKYMYQPDEMSQSQPPETVADDRTFISDIIGFSAFKLMFLLAVPMVLSIFLGAMLVLLFPFPLLTSTSGLAGAAAIGRRQSRTEIDESPQLFQLLGLEDPGGNRGAQYYPNSDNSIGGEEPKGYTRVKKQFKTLKKLRIASEENKENETCLQRIACEIGRENKDPHTRELVGKIINHMPPKRQDKWKSIINSYMDGIQSQNVVMMSDSPNPNLPPAGPVYRHNFCPKYKCSL